MRAHPKTKLREYEAVTAAAETTLRYKDGEHRMKLIDLMYWQKPYGGYMLKDAALKIPCAESVAKEYHREFIRLVASYYGLME